MEPLEERTLLHAVSWIAPEGWDWNNEASWSTGIVPDSDDDVIIDVAGADITVYLSDTAYIKSLHSQETLAVSGGSLHIAAPSEVATLALNEWLGGSGEVTVTSQMDWTGGGMCGTGVTTIARGASLTIDSSRADLYWDQTATGNPLSVKRRRLFGRLKDLRARIKQLRLGHEINTAHVERINGTMPTQQTRLARRTRNVSRHESWLRRALSLWRDGYHWVRPRGSLAGRTPAMAMGLTDRLWTVVDYVRYPVHVGELQRAIWAGDRENLLTTGLSRKKRPIPLPTS